MKFQDARSLLPNKTRSELKRIIDCASGGTKIKYNYPEGYTLRIYYVPKIKNYSGLFPNYHSRHIDIISKKDAEDFNKLVTLIEQERCS